MIGATFGHYQVEGLLGVGGMGEVYRAIDLRLKRSVAIKILPEAFSHDPGRLERFQREAEVLATLSHSNIAVVYGLEEAGGVRAIVLELVEGDTLADRIARGPLPVEDAIDIARQIADALEAAHEKSVIHRDLKPANIKITPDGKVKVLDFGLAKVVEHEPSVSALTLSPTLAVQGTNAGVILGTASYMSPEQARGKTLDKRTDVWAFGCVLFEMLTGTKAFDGDEVSDILAFVITKEPDWAALPANTPVTIRKLLRRCLEKDRKRRLADVADARLEIEESRQQPPPDVAASTTSAPSRRREYLWATTALMFATATTALLLRGVVTRAPDAPTVRFEVPPPEGGRIDRTSTALSPDGRRIVFVVTSESRTRLWVRSLDASTAQPLQDTEDAARPFWSPDSQYVAFFAQGRLKKVPAAGGPLQVVCNLSGTGTYNGSWSAEGVILFAANDQGPVFRVPAAGGQPVPATELNASVKETRHSYPDFLPDGRRFLYLAIAGASRATFIGTLDSNERRALPGVVSAAKYSSTGHLLYLQNTALMAQRFDLTRLELSGGGVQIADRLGGGPLSPLSVSNNGGIAYVGGVFGDTQLAWFDRAGRPVADVGPTGEYRNLELSPDGRFVAFERGAPADLWVLDIQKRLTSRLTSNPAVDLAPVWSPDAHTIAFASEREGAGNIYEHVFGDVGEDSPLLKDDSQKVPTDWSRDGRYVVFGSRFDVWAVPVSGDRKPLRLTQTPATELQGRVSPDGHWIAYASTESGRLDVYVQSFPQPGLKQPVSAAGGIAPRWRRDGKELYYLAPDASLMAVSIGQAGSALEIGTPSPMFQTGLVFVAQVDPRSRAQYDVSPDGRFLMSASPAEKLTVILNWSSGRQ